MLSWVPLRGNELNCDVAPIRPAERCNKSFYNLLNAPENSILTGPTNSVSLQI